MLHDTAISPGRRDSAFRHSGTPELDAGVLTRLEDYAGHFAEDFRHARQAGWCGVYLAGLLQDGERKSIEPVSRRVVLPEGWPVGDPGQALQQFISASPWNEPAPYCRPFMLFRKLTE